MKTRRHFLRNGLWVTAAALGLPAIVRPQVLPSSRRIAAPTPAATSGYSANATTFAGDGQCTMESDAELTGISDGKAGTFSFWVKFTSGSDGTYQRITDNGRISVLRRSDDTLDFLCQDPSSNDIVGLRSNVSITADGNWHHVIISFDKAVETRKHLYIDGTSRMDAQVFLSDDVDGNTASVDWTRGDWAIGSDINSPATNPLKACLSEYWFSTTYLDVSSSPNLQKFRSAGGSPVNLGSDGSTPTGTQPIIYLKSVYSAFTTNSGSGGNFVKKGTTAFTSCTGPS